MMIPNNVDAALPKSFSQPNTNALSLSSMGFSRVLDAVIGNGMNEMKIAQTAGVVAWNNVMAMGKASFLWHFEREGVDMSKAINWNEDGSHTPTNDELAYLHKKYNVSNLSPQEQYDLFQELNAMNALSGDDLSAARVQSQAVHQHCMDENCPYVTGEDVNTNVMTIGARVGKSTRMNTMVPKGNKQVGVEMAWIGKSTEMGTDLYGNFVGIITERQNRPCGQTRKQDEMGSGVLEAQKKVAAILKGISEASGH